jgi:hypothetical protein
MPLAGKQIINIDETRNKKLLTKLEKRFPKSKLKKYLHALHKYSKNKYLSYHVYFITTKK